MQKGQLGKAASSRHDHGRGDSLILSSLKEGDPRRKSAAFPDPAIGSFEGLNIPYALYEIGSSP